MNNIIRSYNLYVLNVCLLLNGFSTQTHVSPYIPKWGRDRDAPATLLNDVKQQGMNKLGFIFSWV
jgi:hypothetical protein